MTVLSFLRQLSWRDAVDVLVVALVVYNLLKLIRGTRAVQILLGIVFVGVAYWAAQLAGLETVGFLLERFLLVLPFAILILFQHEIRRALANFGSNPFLHRPTFQREEAVAESVSQAAVSLAARRIGALVVIERLEGLRDYVERGTGVDAALSADLLVSLFSHGSPLHDGAVILVQGRVSAAGCLLPLSTNQDLASELGTRHRAALGIAEETDAIAIVVSEETGGLSLAHDGRIELDLEPAALRARLVRLQAAALPVATHLGGSPRSSSGIAPRPGDGVPR